MIPELSDIMYNITPFMFSVGFIAEAALALSALGLGADLWGSSKAEKAAKKQREEEMRMRRIDQKNQAIRDMISIIGGQGLAPIAPTTQVSPMQSGQTEAALGQGLGGMSDTLQKMEQINENSRQRELDRKNAVKVAETRNSGKASGVYPAGQGSFSVYNPYGYGNNSVSIPGTGYGQTLNKFLMPSQNELMLSELLNPASQY